MIDNNPELVKKDLNIIDKDVDNIDKNVTEAGDMDTESTVTEEDAQIRDSLISAVHTGRLETVKELVNSFGLSHSKQWQKGYALLCDSIQSEQTEVAKFLISSGSKVSRKNDTSHSTPLHLALFFSSDVELVEMLLKQGALVNAITWGGCTPLHIAAEKGNTRFAELLVQYGADVNAAYTDKFRKGYTPLHVAVTIGHEGIVNLLLCNHAIVDAKAIDTITPLHIAVRQGCLQITKHLLRHGASVAIASSGKWIRGITPLHVAAKQGNEQMIRLLLDHCAEVDATEEQGVTSLHFAAERGDVPIAKLLIKRGACIDSLYTSGWKMGYTPLHMAAEFGSLAVTKLLLNCDASVELKCRDGTTPLFVACVEKSVNVCTTLLTYGADINSMNNVGKTPVDYVLDHLSPSVNRYTASCEEFIGFPSYSDVMEVLIRHAVKMRAQNLYVNDQMFVRVGNYSELRCFQKRCEREIQKLKRKKIDNTNISFYAILTKNDNELAVYARNPNVAKVLESCDCKEEFPIYTDMMKSQLAKGTERERLLQKTNKMFLSTFRKFPTLPCVCTEKILAHLRNKDLANLRNVCRYATAHLVPAVPSVYANIGIVAFSALTLMLTIFYMY